MARRGGRRGRRGGRRGQGNRRGGFGRARGSVGGGSKSKSKSKSSSSKSRGRRGGQGNRSKGFGRAKGTVSRKSVGKGLRSVAKAAGKVASKSKAFAGVRSVASAARAAAGKVKQARADRSSKEARSQRRYDRLAKQHGLDYSRMNPSFKANVNVSQAYKALGLDKNRLTRAVYNKLPKSVRDFSWKHQFKAPTKLGVRDGYRAPNRGGRSIPRGVARDMMMRPEDYQRLRERNPQPGPGIGGIRPIRGGGPKGMPPIGRGADTIAMMYENILGRKADQGGLDYWRNELQSGRQSRDDIRQNIIRSDEFQGRSESDRQSALRGVEQRQSLRRQTRRGKPPRQRHGRGGFGGIGGGFAAAGLGLATRNLRGKGRAKPTGKKPTGRGLFPSIAAAMAARGGL